VQRSETWGILDNIYQPPNRAICLEYLTNLRRLYSVFVFGSSRWDFPFYSTSIHFYSHANELTGYDVIHGYAICN